MGKDGIRYQYLNITVIVLIITFVLSLGAYVYAQKSWDNLTKEQELLREKSAEMANLSNSLTNLFLRVRGYYAFQIDNELQLTYKEIENVRSSIEQIRKLALSRDERTLVDELYVFLLDFEEVTLPTAIDLVQTNDYEGLRKLSLDGSNATVNRFIASADQYDYQMTQKLGDVFNRTSKQLNLYFILVLILGSSLLTVTAWMIWRVVNHVIRPIEQMKSAADNFRSGEDFTFQPIERPDEIGALSASFSKLIHTIRNKEEELLSQNEELITQQDELFDKQEKMEDALAEARFTRVRLENYNSLNHQLSFTLDKQELVDVVLTYFDELYQIDLGSFWLPQSGEHSLIGFTEEKFQQFQANQLEYIFTRLEKTPYYTVKREADYEQGISPTKTYAYDFIGAIKNSYNQFSTAIAISRVGRPFSKEELEDMTGLLNRISLAVDRIEQYEHTHHERTLNKNIIDNVNEGIQFISNEGVMEKHNQALRRLLDFDVDIEDGVLGKCQWLQYILDKTGDNEKLKSFFETSLASEVDSVTQTSYTIPGDTVRVIDVYSVPVVIEGEKAGTIFVHRDITREHEIDQMKTELVSTVSHELRTPLSSVLGFTELLLSKKMEPERQKRYFETIHKEAQRLTTLINDFLDLQRMEHGKQLYNMSNVNLAEIATETVNNLPANDSHTMTIINETQNPFIFADYDKLVQVFTNLLSNAIKFSPEGGEVSITLSEEEENIIVSIQDEGIGIPEEQIPHMFEKFHRIDQGYSRSIGGTGLGLAICRQIIEKHKGKIWIDSREGEGTTIHFSLPIE